MKLFRKRFTARSSSREQSNQRGNCSSSSTTANTTPSASVSSARTVGSITSQSDSVETGCYPQACSVEEAFSATGTTATAAESTRPSYVKRSAKTPSLARQKATCTEPFTPPAMRSAPASQRTSTDTDTVQQYSEREAERTVNLLASPHCTRLHKLSIQHPIYASLTPQPDRRSTQATRKVSSVDSRQTSASSCTLAVPTDKCRSSSLDDNYKNISQSQSSDEELGAARPCDDSTALPPRPPAPLLLGHAHRKASMDLPDICIHCVHEHNYQRKLRRQRSARSESAGSSDDEYNWRGDASLSDSSSSEESPTAARPNAVSMSAAARRAAEMRRKISTPAPPTFQLHVYADNEAQFGEPDSLTLHVPDVRRISSMTDLVKALRTPSDGHSPPGTNSKSGGSNAQAPQAVATSGRSKSMDVRLRVRAHTLCEPNGSDYAHLTTM